MNKIMEWVSSLKLSLVEWAGVTATVVIGGLVAALRIQGGQLHRAQVKLLANQISTQDTSDAQAVATAKATFEAELAAYKAAGGLL